MKRSFCKRTISALLTVALATGLFAGCAGPGNIPTVTGEGSASPAAGDQEAGQAGGESSSGGSKTVMSFACLTGGNNQAFADVLLEIINEFNADNPYNVEFKQEGYANEQYKTKITTLMASNAQPDVFFTWESGFMQPFVAGGKIYPIGDKLAEDAEWSGRFPDESVFGPVTFEDVIYAVPNTRQICVMAYNQAMFDDVGASVPTSYDEFLDACEKLKNGGYTPLIIPCQEAWYGGQFLQQLANGVGGDALFEGIQDGSAAWDDPAFVEAGQMIQDLVARKYLPGNYLGMTPTEAYDMMANGRVAMFYHITSGMADFEKEEIEAYSDIDFFRMPAKTAANSGLNVGSIGQIYAVSSQAQNVDAACAIVKELSSEKYQRPLAEELGQVIVTNYQYDAGKVAYQATKALHLFEQVTTYTPWFDRIFGAGEGVEFNNASVAIMAGGDPQQQMEELQQFAIDNATR